MLYGEHHYWQIVWRAYIASVDGDLVINEYDTCRRIHDEHINALLNQAVCEEGISKSWTDIILMTARRVSSYVHPDVKNDNDHMDIRKYIKFKKVCFQNISFKLKYITSKYTNYLRKFKLMYFL